MKNLIKKYIKLYILNDNKFARILFNIMNYFSTKKKLKNSTGQMGDPKLKSSIRKIILEFEIKNIVEIGTWNGLGSTSMLIELIKDSKKDINFFSVESDRICYNYAKKNLKNELEFVNLILGRVHEIDELDYVNKDVIFDYGYGNREFEWFIQDLRRYKKINNILQELPHNIDILLLDGGEFSGYADFLNLYQRTNFIILDDVNTFKQHHVLEFISNNKESFQLIYESGLRSGVKIYRFLKFQ